MLNITINILLSPHSFKSKFAFGNEMINNFVTLFLEKKLCKII